MKRPAIVFDFGNVIAHFDYAKACARLGEPIGRSGPELLAMARSKGLNDVVKVFEAGLMSNEEFAKQFCELVGIDLGFEQFALAWGDIFWPNPSVIGLIPGLKELGYTLILGSNTNELHSRVFLPQFQDTFRHFDALVLSYQVGHIKPSGAFYLACASAAGEAPDSCIFIDDLEENVAGANSAGLNGLLYTNTPQLIDDLRLRGVTIGAHD